MTQAQAQVLAYVRAQGFGERAFSAQDVFPGRTPQDNANRRVLRNLVRDGHVTHAAPHRMLYQCAQHDDDRPRERETSIGHKAEHQRGQDMGL